MCIFTLEEIFHFKIEKLLDCDQLVYIRFMNIIGNIYEIRVDMTCTM